MAEDGEATTGSRNAMIADIHVGAMLGAFKEGAKIDDEITEEMLETAIIHAHRDSLTTRLNTESIIDLMEKEISETKRALYHLKVLGVLFIVDIFYLIFR